MAAAVGERQDESILPSCAQEEGDGQVPIQILVNGEGGVAAGVLVPEPSSNVFCNKEWWGEGGVSVSRPGERTEVCKMCSELHKT